MATKYAIIIPDGAADEPVESLGGRTPLQAAAIPEMDRDRPRGDSRPFPQRARPIFAGERRGDPQPLRLRPGPLLHGTRAPLEVVAMGIPLGPDDWAVRCNLMNITDGRLTDFTAGHVSSEEAAELIAALADGLRGRVSARRVPRLA